MTYGTAHFTSSEAARRYYRPLGYGARDVARKVQDGEIHIGAPALKPGERLSVIRGEGRYAITGPRA